MRPDATQSAYCLISYGEQSEDDDIYGPFESEEAANKYADTLNDATELELIVKPLRAVRKAS